MSSELLDGRPVEGDAPQVRMVGNNLGELATKARFARQQLAALQRGELKACWVGVAADAFAAELEVLPADLGKLELSLDKASTALQRWASTIDRLQPEGDREKRSHGSAFRQNVDAQAELAAQRLAIVDRIEDAVNGADRLAPFERRADDAQAELRRIDNRLRGIRDEADAIARSVANMLDEASRLGIQNKSDWDKFVGWLEDIRDGLVEILAFLDELIDLISPFLDMAFLIIGLFNPALGAALSLGLAIIDLGLTAGRAVLGDDRVDFKDLLDDGIGLAFAAVGAKGAFKAAKAAKGLKAAKATKNAKAIRNAQKAVDAAEGGKLIKAVDKAGDAATVADYYLNLGDMVEVGPGSTFDAAFDVANGDTDTWAFEGGDAYGSDFNEAAGDLFDGGDAGGDFDMPDFEFEKFDNGGGEIVEPPGEITPPEITPPPGGGEGGGGIAPPPGGGEGGGGIAPPAGGGEGGGGIAPPAGGGGTGGGNPPSFVPPTDSGSMPGGGSAGAGAIVIDGQIPGGDYTASPTIGEPASASAAVSPVGAPAVARPPVVISEPPPVVATMGTAGSSGSTSVAGAAAAGAAVLGLSSAAVGAKRLVDKDKADNRDSVKQDTDKAEGQDDE